MPLIECVPNFSEGRDTQIITAITDEIKSVEGITLLDVDPGKDTNRTVVTFVGDIAEVEEAAFRGIKKASELIDMSKHSGTHPRMGATDVCPFIPVSGVDVEDCIEISKRVGKRVGEELGIPIYLYEHSAQKPDRTNLAIIREGEYEGLAKKLENPHWAPDFGPAKMNSKAGATVIGCREFLIAYNINLNTRDKRLATDIAFELREKGRTIREQHPNSKNYLDGKIIRYKEGNFPCSFCDETFTDTGSLTSHSTDTHDFDIHTYWKSIGYSKDDLIGKSVKQPGLFKDVKAIGWYIDEFNRAQISINFTNYKNSTIHDVFDKACEISEKRGVRVTGSELVGLVPLEAMLMAGRHYLNKQQRTTGVPQDVIVETAIQSLGLNEIAPFNVHEKIIDFAVGAGKTGPLMGLSVTDFIRECSTNSPAPGGGSVAALAGSLGAALTSMVAALTHEKQGYFDSKSRMDVIGMEAQRIKDRLVFLVDEDTHAFNRVMSANRLPASTEQEKTAKSESIVIANRYAVEVPMEVAELSFKMMECAKEIVVKGNPNSVSDAGVANEVGYAAVRGAVLNVLINIAGMSDDPLFAKEMKKKADLLVKQSESLHAEVFDLTLGVIGK
ncbi:MAG: glutamate formimidoyltransferase [Candidatus Marinimicrobia bacterium]|nr:glutamate formimidoyltransferase [Candidatus Neomarinimicrobiota bacterium]